MKGGQRLLIQTPWPELNSELKVQCALLDAIVHKWSPEQAQAALLRINGLHQIEIAKKLNISQPAVQFRLQGAGSWAIEELKNHFEQGIKQNISPRTYNGQL